MAALTATTIKGQTQLNHLIKLKKKTKKKSFDRITEKKKKEKTSFSEPNYSRRDLADEERNEARGGGLQNGMTVKGDEKVVSREERNKNNEEKIKRKKIYQFIVKQL